MGHATTQRANARRWTSGLTIAALALGSFRLGDKGLWLDEVASLNFALGGPEVWFADHNMSLYYALLAGVVELAGRAEVALRALSVACFAGCVLSLRALGARLFGERAGRLGSVLLMTNATFVHFAQEARGYMLAALLVCLSSLLLVKLLERPRALLALGYGAASGLAMYAHLFAAWVALAHALLALHAFWRGASLRWLLPAFGLSGALAVPLVLGVLDRGVGQISWIYPPTPARVWAGVVLLGGGSAALAALQLALLGLSVRAAEPGAITRLLPIVWWLVPLLASYAFSWLVSPIVHPKYLLVVVPALALGAGVALDRLPSHALRGALLAALLALSLGRLHFWFGTFQKEQWREAVATLAARARPGDVLVLDVMLAEPLDYYVERSGAAARLPALLRPARGWGLPPPEERPVSPEALRAALAAAPRVWLVRNRSEAFDARAWLGATHPLVQTLTLEPRDEDAAPPLFADPRGRVITLQLFARSAPHAAADPGSRCASTVTCSAL